MLLTKLKIAAVMGLTIAAGVGAGGLIGDDKIKTSGTLDGKKVQFPARSVAEGVKATIGLLESCHSASDDTIKYTAADLKKAKQGDHVRLVFGKPITVTVLGDKFEVSELVFTQPLNTGVFWLRFGDKVVRCTKYEYEKQKRFEAWRQQAQPADCLPAGQPDSKPKADRATEIRALRAVKKELAALEAQIAVKEKELADLRKKAAALQAKVVEAKLGQIVDAAIEEASSLYPCARVEALQVLSEARSEISDSRFEISEGARQAFLTRLATARAELVKKQK